MKAALIITAWTVIHLWLLWYLYILVMGLYRANLDNRLTRFTKLMALPALVVGFVLDWLANWTVATVVFGEPPESPFELVTARLTRYLSDPSTRRFRVVRAQWLCENLLDFFDPCGAHCR